MKVLVVGGTSNLARALKPLLSEFSQVMTAGRCDCDHFLDLSDPLAEIVLPTGIDVVVNAAASFGGVGANDMVQAETVNAVGALRLGHACVAAQVRHLVQISSIFATLDESSPFYSIYALSKKHAEDALKLYCAKGELALTILRPSQFYGAGERYRKHQPFLFSIMDKAAAGEDISIFGSRDALRNFIHIEDVAEIVARVVEQGVIGQYACIAPENISYSRIAGAAIRAFESKGKVVFVKDRPDIADNAFEPDDTLYRLIKYSPKIDILSGMMKEASHRKEQR